MSDTVTIVTSGQRGLPGNDGAPGLPVDILATAPVSPTEGYTYYNTTDHKLWYWNGTAWVDVTAGGGSTDALTLQGQNGAYYRSRDNHTGPSGSKTTPVNADNVVLLDSAASGVAKNLTWANTKATLKTYFDTVYEAIGGGSLGIGDSITGLTQGSVLFGGSGGILDQDNSHLFYDKANTQLSLTSGAVGNTPLKITAIAAQTAPLFKITKSDGTTNLLSLDNDGWLTIGFNNSYPYSGLKLHNAQVMRYSDYDSAILIGALANSAGLYLSSGYLWDAIRLSSPASGGATFAFYSTTPATITANQNNYQSGRGSFWQRWSSNAARDITGYKSCPGVDPFDGEIIRIVNVGSFNITLKHQSASSTDKHRFLNSTGADIVLAPNQAADLIYDLTTLRWRVFKKN